jgi:short-chain fatty acids transporter
MGFLGRIALALTRWTERWVPSSFVIAILLTLVIFILAVSLTSTGPLDCVRYWGGGFWSLLGFGMQMTLIMVSGYLVAVSPPVERLLGALARVPRGPRSCVAWMAFLSMTLALLHWGLSIVVSAVMVKRFARQQPEVDYRLLVTAAYLGLGTTWHAGLSASAPLLVATPGHFLEEQMGVIPLTETIFSPFNLILAAIVIVVFTVLIPLMHPARGKALTVEAALLAEGEAGEPQAAEEKSGGFAGRIDNWPALGRIVAALGLLWLILHFAAGGSVTLNVVNFAYLMLGIGLHGRASSIVAAVENGVRLASGVILQFPLYAGMFGIIRDSGLTEVISNAFVTIANNRSYSALVYWYSGIVNYFVPSGGSKWAIEAPYLVDAARTLQVKVSSTVLAYSWGDMLTNIIQPFWALPILRAAGLDFRHILGYAMVVFAIYGALVSVAFWLYPP